MDSIFQTIGGLGVVIVLIFATAWIMRGSQRFGLRGNPALKVVATQALTARERVVVIEVDNQWLVLGVAPGQVTRLGRMAKPGNAPLDGPGIVSAYGGSPNPTSHSFASWLERALQRK